jgi:hypothetical protein
MRHLVAGPHVPGCLPRTQARVDATISSFVTRTVTVRWKEPSGCAPPHPNDVFLNGGAGAWITPWVTLSFTHSLFPQVPFDILGGEAGFLGDAVYVAHPRGALDQAVGRFVVGGFRLPTMPNPLGAESV